MLAHRLGHGQPAEPVGQLGRVGVAPQRRVLLPDPVADVGLGRLLDLARDRRLEVVGQRCLDRWRALGDDCLALGVQAGEQLFHRLDELVDAVAQELVGDVVEVDARLGQRLQVGFGVLLDRCVADVGVVGRGQQGGHRHRVDRVGPDEPVDVQRVGVLRVLDAGRRPQRPLDGGPGLAQLGEALAQEDRLVAPVGGARVGQAGAAVQVAPAERVESLVDLGVDARDEERGDRVDVDAEALGAAALEAADERLDHALVGGDREQQRDVDVAALVDHLLDRRGRPRRCRGS